MSGPSEAGLYDTLASWFHLLTAPEDYAEEASFVLESLREHVAGSLEDLLELGSGGGNLASHLKGELRLTLTDLSPPMIELSRSLNPDCEHLVGDMRTLRVGRTFDAVLIHDAICYMTTQDDLRAAMLTAFAHLRPGGAAVFMPDFTRETFEPGTDRGGHDGPALAHGQPGRALRYLDWVTDPDPTDSTYQVDYAILTRDAAGSVRVHHVQEIEGLFPHQTWLDLLTDVGFSTTSVGDPEGRIVFIGRRPGTEAMDPA